MKHFIKSLAFVLVVLAASAIPVLAQTPVTRTTLSSAIGTVASGQSTTINVTSTTGMTASTNSAQTFILVDTEIMRVVSLSPFVVSRGEMGTKVSAHVSGSYVFYGNAGTWSNNTSNASGVFVNSDPVGACTRSNNQYLPVFNPNPVNPRVFDCNGGSWVRDSLPISVTVSAIRDTCTYKIGNSGAIVADLTTYGTDATRVSGTIYVASFSVAKTKLVTGLSSLTGTTAPTTDKQIFAIYDSGGTLIANTAIAGVAAATADIFFDQVIAQVNGATATSLLLLPGRYFFALQLNGTTTTIQMIPGAGGFTDGVANSRTGTFGTLPAITVPTTFTTSTGPIGCTY